MKETKKHEKAGVSHKNHVGTEKNVLDFFKKYKGFTIALVVVIAIIIAFFFLNFDFDLSQEKASYAQQIHENNTTLFTDYLSVIEEVGKLDQNDTLEDDYTASMKDDVLWLMEKEKNIYSSNPRSEVFSKEVAITMLVQAIMQVNSDYMLATGETNYNEKINEALTLEIKQLKLLTTEEITSTFPTETDKKIYFEQLDLLWREYFNSKISVIKISSSTERKYIEARKLIWMTQYYVE